MPLYNKKYISQSLIYFISKLNYFTFLITVTNAASISIW